MVWLWIVIAVTISLVLFKKYKLKYYHFIWALLPIDSYGFQVEGITIKPYMIFMFALILLSGKIVMSNKHRTFLAFCVCAFLLSDVFNGFPMESVMQHLYFILIFIFAIHYSVLSSGDSESIRKSIVLSGFAFTITFVLAYYSYVYAILIGQIEGTMVRGYFELHDGLYIAADRFRGFEIDPNAFCIMIIPVVSACIYSICRKKQRTVCVVTICLSFACVLFSESRTGMILFFTTLIFTAGVSFNSNGRRYGKSVIVILVIVAVMVLIIQLNVINISDITAYFESRSKINDTYGRMNIWKECIKYVWTESPFLGLGSNQVRLYEPLSRACHNTWIEWICSVGFLFGLIVDIVFLFPLLKNWRKVLIRNNKEHGWVYATYCCIFLFLVTIDYVASVYLLCFFCLNDKLQDGSNSLVKDTTDYFSIKLKKVQTKRRS